jgi:hypothetical protein
MTSGNFSRTQAVASPIRATDRDRDATIGVIQASFTVGRLSRDEHDARVAQALAAQTYADLDLLTADLPGRPGYPDAPGVPMPRRTNGMAIASLVCGAAQPVTGMLTTIPAIVFGHVARRQIQRNGEDGGELAKWGLILGWAGLTAIIMAVLAIVAFVLLIAASVSGS